MYLISGHRQWFSYRGLSPYKFMPMLGAHKALHLTAIPQHSITADELGRYLDKRKSNATYIV